MGILQTIKSPADVRALAPHQLDDLCQEIRELLIHKVSATGGHLGPNLGVVELTVALHRIFESPRDAMVFDTSHQAYVHKILTGRADQFDTLRKKGGLSGYTDRSESEHDWTESSHASAALSYVDGLSKGFKIQGLDNRTAIGIVGDGAMTGGMCWEALNNIAADKQRNVVIVVNDNGRSYSPTIGGFAENLAELRMMRTYDKVMEQGKSTLNSMGWVGRRTFDALHAFKEGVKSSVLPTEMFPELGMKYVGPVNGHDIKSLLNAFEYARDYEGPIIVHVVTEKGHGFAPAATESDDLMHATGIIDPVTGRPTAHSGPSWTSVFSQELLDAAASRPDLVAITAAMAGPTGLSPFAAKHPERFFDVGIAEQHAVTSAAGLALTGLHPVVALYSTFLNRGFDQLVMDVGLLHQPVTFVLDRAGVTGSDGASHNGVWDLAITSIVPGMRIAAPRDGEQLRQLFREAIEVDDGPTVVRFPKGELPEVIAAVGATEDGVDVLRYSDPEGAEVNGVAGEAGEQVDVLFVAIGALAGAVLAAAEELAGDGIGITVVDPRWVSPVPQSLLALAADHDLVVTVEDGIIRGGIGSQFAEALTAAEIDTPVRHCAFPDIYPKHASRTELLAEVGLDAAGIAAATRGWLTTLFSG